MELIPDFLEPVFNPRQVKAFFRSGRFREYRKITKRCQGMAAFFPTRGDRYGDEEALQLGLYEGSLMLVK